MAIPFVWHPRTRRHVPGAEIYLGVRRPEVEAASRVETIRNALVAAKHPEVTAVPQDDEILLSVHDPDLINHLKTAWDAWQVAGLATDPGQDRVVPYLIPGADMMHGLPFRGRQAIQAKAGRFCYDTITLIAQGTWDAARASVDTAQTAADLVAQGEHVAYALCRPPGNHAARASFGGGCYLNNAAVAAQTLRASGFQKVAVIDIDAHHGNGTQAIFYDRPDVFFGSLHVDPAAGWFPHFVGFADEVGRGAAEGTSLNVPLPQGAGDDLWLAGISRLRLAIEDFDADVLVISLGMDACAEDPTSPLKVTRSGYEEAAALLSGLGLPAVLVQEGGYDLKTLGSYVTATLAAWNG